MSVVTCQAGHPLYEQFGHNPQRIKYLGLDIQVESGPWFATKWKQKAKAFAEDFCGEYQNKFCFLVEKSGAICIWLEKKKAEFNQPKTERQIVSSSISEQAQTQLKTNQDESLEAAIDDQEFAQLWMQLEALADSVPKKEQNGHSYPRVTSISDSYGRVSKLSVVPQKSPSQEKLPEVMSNNPVLESTEPEIRVRRRYRGVEY